MLSLLLHTLFLLTSATDFLAIDKTNHTFTLGGRRVFLSGVNMPWINYGGDFGGDTAATGEGFGQFCSLDEYLRNISKAGGNTIRFWLFVEGTTIPTFLPDGTVNSTDITDSLITDLRRYMEQAQRYNIMIQWCLWNGAVLKPTDGIWGLIHDTSKLQTFIDKVLTPVVNALKEYPSLAGYEIMNEPEGSVLNNVKDSEPCFDTTILKGTGAGWTGNNIPMKLFQQFANLQAAAIHAADPKALVTQGSWSMHATVDTEGNFNYWKDECLIAAGGKKSGTLDFYQVHAYPWNNKFEAGSPFTVSFLDYKLDRPLVVGEFIATGAPLTSPQEYTYLYNHGYSGAWGWSAIGGEKVDDLVILSTGMQAIRDQPNVPINITDGKPKVSCSCSDKPPSTDYTCAQQASWGKCLEDFMQGLCCRSCHGCKGCV